MLYSRFHDKTTEKNVETIILKLNVLLKFYRVSKLAFDIKSDYDTRQ